MLTAMHTASPDGAAMTIWRERPNTLHDIGVPTRLLIRRADGTDGALSAAGLVAIIEAASGYLSSLTPTARGEIVVPAAPGDADDLAVALADVLAADGNVITDPAS
jgi:hypothetical protein